MIDKKNKIIPENISNNQKTDTGLALTLLFLLIGLFTNNILFFKLTIPIILITMLIPSLLHPIAIIWFTLTNVIGFFVSKIVLSVIFILFIIPLGFLRKLMKKDSLKLKEFKKSKSSVFINKEHTFTLKDILKPF